MRYLSAQEAKLVQPYLDRAYALTKKGNCLESQYGAVIFKGNDILGEGFNHVPEVMMPQFTCESCPRHKESSNLHMGVGFELCISIHAEGAAIENMFFEKKHTMQDSSGAKIVVARVKDSQRKVPEVLKPYCTKCSGQIATQTEIDEVIFETKSGLVAFKRIDFHVRSINNLYLNWKEVLKDSA